MVLWHIDSLWSMASLRIFTSFLLLFIFMCLLRECSLAFHPLCGFLMGSHSSSWCFYSTDFISPQQIASSLPLPISITFTITYKRPWHQALTTDIAKIKFQTVSPLHSSHFHLGSYSTLPGNVTSTYTQIQYTRNWSHYPSPSEVSAFSFLVSSAHTLLLCCIMI